MPITCPERLSNGPPELPEFTAASVWIRSVRLSVRWVLLPEVEAVTGRPLPEMIPLVAIHLGGQLVGTIFLSVTLGGDEDILAYHYNGHKYVQLRYWVLAILASVLPIITLCGCIYCCAMAADAASLLLMGLAVFVTAFCTFIGVCGTYSIWQIHQREQQAAARRCQYSIH